MSADKVQVVDIPDGQRFYVTRGECTAKFDVFSDHVHWQSLQSPGSQRWVETAHDMAREVFPSFGIKYLTAMAGTPESEATLKRHGDWQGEGMLRWDL